MAKGHQPGARSRGAWRPELLVYIKFTMINKSHTWAECISVFAVFLKAKIAILLLTLHKLSSGNKNIVFISSILTFSDEMYFSVFGEIYRACNFMTHMLRYLFHLVSYDISYPYTWILFDNYLAIETHCGKYYHILLKFVPFSGLLWHLWKILPHFSIRYAAELINLFWIFL